VSLVTPVAMATMMAPTANFMAMVVIVVVVVASPRFITPMIAIVAIGAIIHAALIVHVALIILAGGSVVGTIVLVILHVLSADLALLIAVTRRAVILGKGHGAHHGEQDSSGGDQGFHWMHFLGITLTTSQQAIRCINTKNYSCAAVFFYKPANVGFRTSLADSAINRSCGVQGRPANI
jgi:hypothetical protein